MLQLVDCEPGNFLSPESTCQQCSKCPSTEDVKMPCNSTHDTVCSCSTGFYRDKLDGVCKECRKCGVGKGASPACTAYSNTVCIVCPKGSYSDIESGRKSCQSCTQCGVNEFSLQKCTAEQDTVCFSEYTLYKYNNPFFDVCNPLPFEIDLNIAEWNQSTAVYKSTVNIKAMKSFTSSLLLYSSKSPCQGSQFRLQ